MNCRRRKILNATRMTLALLGFVGVLFTFVVHRFSPRTVEARDGSEIKNLRSYGARLPLQFERNEGQLNASAKYFSRGRGYALFLTSHDAVIRLHEQGKTRDSILRMRFIGANAQPEIVGEAE